MAAAATSAGQRWLLAVMVLDAVLLALLELFFLPWRLDGTTLPRVGADLPFPVVVVLAVATTPLLVSVTARVVRPGLAFIPLLVWVFVIVIVGFFGPGGDVVLVQDWRALLLLGGGALPGAMAFGGGFDTVKRTR
jgi:hypothetical protein